MSERRGDCIVVGAGIGGASVAAEYAAHGHVLLLEMESHPGTHSTGRSAAFFSPAYGNEVVRGITAASEAFYRAPPLEFFGPDIIRPRDCLFIGREDQAASLDKLEQDISLLRRLDSEEVAARLPILRPGHITGALCDSTGGDLDVDLALQGYLRQLRARGGELFTDCEVLRMHRQGGLWHVYTDGECFSAPVVVNAAGAWADSLAECAGLVGLGIEPRRRTAILVEPPAGVDISDWPLVVDVDEEFYFKPDAGQLLLSPADETPCAAADVQADEWDIALAVDRVTKVLDLAVHRVNYRWAGLRNFSSDRTPLVGEDPRAAGFFWLAGQGGYGVQAAPGLAKLAVHLATGASLTQNDADLAHYVDAVDPRRLLA